MAYVKHEDLCCAFKGDTLLAIRAPTGTQLEVPLPEPVLNGQKRYQVRLKSSAGPIEVLLVNKDPSSPSPVVLPVPPPEDMLHSLPVPAADTPKPAPAAPRPLAPSSNAGPATLSPACTATTPQAVSNAVFSSNTSTPDLSTPTTNTTTEATPTLDTQTLESSASLDGFLAVFEPIKTDSCELLDFPKEMSDMFDPKEIMNADLLEELMSSEVFSPLLRLSPPPGDHDYNYNLDETEGLCDLFDVPILNL